MVTEKAACQALGFLVASGIAVLSFGIPAPIVIMAGILFLVCR